MSGFLASGVGSDFVGSALCVGSGVWSWGSESEFFGLKSK